MHSVPAWEHPVGASAPCPLPPSPPRRGSVASGQGDLVTLRLDSMLPAEFAPLLIRELLPPRDLYGVAVHACGLWIACPWIHLTPRCPRANSLRPPRQCDVEVELLKHLPTSSRAATVSGSSTLCPPPTPGWSPGRSRWWVRWWERCWRL